MNADWLSHLKHIFKLDPNKKISDNEIKRLCQSGTDGIVVGGTLNITYEDTEDLLRRIRPYSISVIQEISNLQAIVPGFDHYFIPFVLNAQNPDWILNVHHQALKKYGKLIAWNQVSLEGYIVLNEEASVAKLTESKTNLCLEDVLAYGRMSDQMLRLPILYIEYSGKYGNVEWIKKLREMVSHSQIFYGGGIQSVEQAREMARYADTIIVGNLIYENFDIALQTVEKEK